MDTKGQGDHEESVGHRRTRKWNESQGLIFRALCSVTDTLQLEPVMQDGVLVPQKSYFQPTPKIKVTSFEFSRPTCSYRKLLITSC